MAIPYVSDLERAFVDAGKAVTIHPLVQGERDNQTGEREFTGDDIETTCVPEDVATTDVVQSHGIVELADTKLLVFAEDQSDTYAGISLPNTLWRFRFGGERFAVISWQRTPDGIAYWLFGRRMNR